ncbi:putative Yip1 protein [Plasmodium knowlesi]|uniref:Putative Yip1 protein n=1 Tax=Plasmodium knowlesi TaxID=5850 RepID=A0A1Y3DKT2_PLAKN|nr:putative Yip1 protein [Plasmodium knowlesi]
MNYYNQKIINRANSRNDNNDSSLGSNESNLNNLGGNVTNPYVNKKIYEGSYNKPINNVIPNAPFENNFYQSSATAVPKGFNFTQNSGIGSVNHNQNHNNVVTSPFNNPPSANEDAATSGESFFGNFMSANKNKLKNDVPKREEDEEEEEEELPLLEELGINFDLISKRMKSVFMFYKIDDTLFENSDLSGPLIIVLALGFILLLAGKASFSYIYLIGIVSSLSIYLLLNMMSQNLTLDLYRTISMLGYALLPLVILSFISIIINLRSKKGYTISFCCISWSALTASRFFEVV